MFHYKRFYVWFNDAQNSWLIQSGYEIVGSAQTAGAAKGIITRNINKGIWS